MNTREKLSVATGDCLKPLASSPGWRTEPLEAVGVDPKIGKAGAVRNYVVALCGEFKTPGRGRFSEESLREIQKLWPRAGLPVHAQHGNFLDDGLLAYLGRAIDPVQSKAIRVDADGSRQFVPAIRATLMFDPAARVTPGGNLIEYFSQRVESDSGSLSSSLELNVDCALETDSRGRSLRDEAGNTLPPVWTPTKLWASDFVSVGDAVDNLLGLTANTNEGLRFLRQAERKQQVANLAAEDLEDRQWRNAERKKRAARLAPFDASRDPEIVRRQMNARQRLWSLTQGVVATNLNGQRPTSAEVVTVRNSLHKIPFGLRHELFKRDAKVEIIDAARTIDHPSYRGQPKSLAGFATGRLAIVNARHIANTPLTALHEYGHLVDNCLGLSGTVAWQYTFGNGSEDDAAELFAESFAAYFHGPKTRNGLSGVIRRYFAGLEKHFVSKPIADAVA